VFVKLQTFTSIAGDPRRPDANRLFVTPTLIHAIQQDWWVLVDSETKTDWELGGRTGVKSGVQVGRGIGSNIGVWIKPELWWGPNQDGRWNLKFGLIMYQLRRSQRPQ
jgi:hypothetical protein